MTRFDLLQLLVGQARSNGFQYRRWYGRWLGLPWDGPREATEVLCEGRRYYALLFSREFAENFWKSGAQMTMQVPTQRFERRMADGTIGTVTRKAFTRRLTRPDAWRYHLQQMAVAEDPLRYIRRFLRIEDDLEKEQENEQVMEQENEREMEQKDSAGAPGLERDPRFIVDEEDLLPDDSAED